MSSDVQSVSDDCLADASRMLTDRAVRALKPRAKQYDVPDGNVRGLALRVNKASKTFVFVGRINGGKATRHKLGCYPEMSLADARAKALEWRVAIAQGRDPSRETSGNAARAALPRFAYVCELYFADMKRRGLRRAHEVEREIRRTMISRWASKPIDTIDRMDVLSVIDDILTRQKSAQAHHVLSFASRLFNFAIERGYIEHSPCDRIKPSRLIGPKVARTRILTDEELRVLWGAAENMGYPWGPFVQMLMLTGQRRTEVAHARWTEIDSGIWVIPSTRYKTGAAHSVPIVPELRRLLDSISYSDCDYLFTSNGRTPIAAFSKAKRRIDAAMQAEDWTFHDVRRTMRTHLSALPIPDLVRELVIGHAQRGLHKIYDRHLYADEKTKALLLWTSRLIRIVR
jgi:integrase